MLVRAGGLCTTSCDFSRQQFLTKKYCDRVGEDGFVRDRSKIDIYQPKPAPTDRLFVMYEIVNTGRRGKLTIEILAQ